MSKMKDEKDNTESKYKCRECGRIWSKDEIIKSKSIPPKFLCGYVPCGGVVDKIEEGDENENRLLS